MAILRQFGLEEDVSFMPALTTLKDRNKRFFYNLKLLDLLVNLFLKFLLGELIVP